MKNCKCPWTWSHVLLIHVYIVGLILFVEVGTRVSAKFKEYREEKRQEQLDLELDLEAMQILRDDLYSGTWKVEKVTASYFADGYLILGDMKVTRMICIPGFHFSNELSRKSAKAYLDSKRLKIDFFE